MGIYMKIVKGLGFYKSVKAENHQALAENMVLDGCHCLVRKRLC